MADIQYLKNDKLDIILDGWQGNPHNGKRFFDPHKAFSPSFAKFWKWQTGPKPKAKEKKADTWRLGTVKDKKFLKTKDNCIVWLGHASFYIRLNGVQIITDPVFYNLSGIVRRHSDMPCEVSDFKNIDYVLLSHGHRDHCDATSLKAAGTEIPGGRMVPAICQPQRRPEDILSACAALEQPLPLGPE
jgi:hypothetical protein